MNFNDVIGQDDIKAFLKREADTAHVPHAMMFVGDTGYGTLAMAMAFANYLLDNGHNQDKLNKLLHPDLHFSFPVIKKDKHDGICDDFMKEWIDSLKEGAYFGLQEWLEVIGAENKQARIFEAEGDNIIDKMSLTSYEGGYKIMIIWLPERMGTEAANNLLKILEEPQGKSLFILVAEDTTKILSTIISRTQIVDFPPLSMNVMVDTLEHKNGIDHNSAVQIAKISSGSYLKALRIINSAESDNVFFELFVNVMRMAYSRQVQQMQQWAEDIVAMGREKQKDFLEYMQNMLRENFMFNFKTNELNFMTDKEAAFAVKFARFINERNIIEFTDTIAVAQRDILQNVNGKIVFFNLALKIAILIRK
ncbi:MAG: DNA polymerase III subunit delta [Prevotellaceae bacterium]|nr:DNA polymerase III subunit delta [Candidatus Faecinaster equi]